MADWEAYLGELVAEEPEAWATWNALTHEERAGLVRWIGRGLRDHRGRAAELAAVLRGGRDELSAWTVRLRGSLPSSVSSTPGA